MDVTVITNDRPHSLNRLLSSLQNARYFGDTLNLRINLEQDADPQTLRMVERLQWNRGAVFVSHRVIHGGLLPAVVESWYPHSNDSYGLILEDDVELSPLFYAWVKMTLLRYRYIRVLVICALHSLYIDTATSTTYHRTYSESACINRKTSK